MAITSPGLIVKLIFRKISVVSIASETFLNWSIFVFLSINNFIKKSREKLSF
jgi:hypothetical protein